MSRVPHVWLARAALCALTVLCYANTFDAGFVFDSRAIILGDTRIREVTAGHLQAIGGQSYWGTTLDSPLYRPATTASFLFNYAVLGNEDRPAGYHAVNLLLHVSNVLLAFAVGRRLAGAWPATIVAALWAVHPVLTEAVTNIVGRADLLAGLGVLGGFYAYLRSTDVDRPVRWLALSTAAAGLAVFSKESGVAFPGVVIAYDLLLRRPAVPIKRLLPVWLAVATPVALFVFLRTTIPTHAASELVFVDNPIAGASFVTGALTALSVAGRYLWLLAWPRGLSPDYSYAQIELFAGRQDEWLALATIGVVVGLAALVGRFNGLVLFLAVATAVAFLPVSNLLFPTGTIMAERLMYLPSLGAIACLVTMGSGRVFRDEIDLRKPDLTPLVVILIGLCAVGTWMRNPVWRSELSLWTSALEAAPRSFKAHSSFAEALYQSDPGRARLPEAAAAADRSLAILDALPGDRRAPGVYRQAASYHFELGDLLKQREAIVDARASYRRAAELLERYLALLGDRASLAAERAEAQRMLSAALLQLEDGAKAVDTARLALARQPFNAANYRAVAAALIQARRFDEAAVVLTTGVMVTGNADLRAASLELYRSGLDDQGCAVSTTAGASVLNPDCPIVQRHICEAGVAAIAVQRAAGRADLAEVLERSVVAAMRCPSG